MRRPKIKAHHNPVRLPDKRIIIGSLQFGVGAELSDDPTGTTWQLLGLMDGSRSTEQIIEDMRRWSPHLTSQAVRDAVATLVDSGFVEDADAVPPASLTAADLRRYVSNRHYFSWVDDRPRQTPWDIQERLKAARVTIVGVGGTGSAIAAALTAAGVGMLRLVDFDAVQESNLTRQLLYAETDVGCAKTAAAANRLAAINSAVTIETVQLRIAGADDLVDVTKGADLLVLCAENAQFWASEAAAVTNVPWLLCAYAGPMVVTGIFVPGRTPCWGCLVATAPNAVSFTRDVESRPVEIVNPVIAPVANISGHFGALEAIYYLADLRAQTVGRVLHQNLMTYDHMYYVEPAFVPECATCGSQSR